MLATTIHHDSRGKKRKRVKVRKPTLAYKVTKGDNPRGKKPEVRISWIIRTGGFHTFEVIKQMNKN